ncbi:MAG: phosphoribosylformylglycinamidine cyclo-ligase [Leptospiraceae bacterium]|nr:phosphoribosylformylglycinamidine cyclo-ligase [Leptospiraceae bacterium]
MSNEEISYRSSGVDTHAGQEFVNRIKKNVNSTHNPRVLGGLGGFAAAYDASFLKNYREPILVSCTDGVGTKLELARLLGIHNTVGIDLVAMSVNDLLVTGARPLYFLDYIACGKLDVSKMDEIVSGIVTGCKLCGAALVGGETAEHPGLMKEDEYDLAGFAVGAVEKSDMIDGSKVQAGDMIIGLASSGPHSNGFSLLRKLFLKEGKFLPDSEKEISFLKDYVLTPTKIYVESVLKVLLKEEIKGMVHITGGGFYENIPRILPKNLEAIVTRKHLPKHYLFERIQSEFSISEKELFSTFNMGTGFMLIVDKLSADKIVQLFQEQGEGASIIGEIKDGERNVQLID